MIMYGSVSNTSNERGAMGRERISTGNCNEKMYKNLQIYIEFNPEKSMDLSGTQKNR